MFPSGRLNDHSKNIMFEVGYPAVLLYCWIPGGITLHYLSSHVRELLLLGIFFRVYSRLNIMDHAPHGRMSRGLAVDGPSVQDMQFHACYSCNSS